MGYDPFEFAPEVSGDRFPLLEGAGGHGYGNEWPAAIFGSVSGPFAKQAAFRRTKRAYRKRTKLQ
jgi:hypothetical protein